MDIKTAFSPGDEAWAIVNGEPRLLTVGMVRVEIVDSPGVNEGVTMPECPDVAFDNYKPHCHRKEEYMMIETGIGSGLVFELGRLVFRTHEGAIVGCRLFKEALDARQ